MSQIAKIEVSGVKPQNISKWIQKNLAYFLCLDLSCFLEVPLTHIQRRW